jgi:hypothetical protein
MNKTNSLVASITDTSTLTRAKFGPGMLLQHEDLEQLNIYTRDLSRLLFRSFFGCGVICGLVVSAEVDNCNKVSVTVGPGLALDCLGDPVHVPKDQTLVVKETCYPDLPGQLWVILCGTTKNCAPRTSMCGDDDNTTSACTRERGMFEIRVVSALPKCMCGYDEPDGYSGQKVMERKVIERMEGMEDTCKCADPNLPYHKHHYDGMCGCNCGSGSNCACDHILLARLDKVETASKWAVDHRIRRFIRPVLMRDPQVELEEQDRQYTKKQAQYAWDAENAEAGARTASMAATAAGEAADKAVYEANVAAEVQATKFAAAEAAMSQVAKAKTAANKARAAADKTKAAADKAAGDKAAADKAAADADKAKEAAAELDKAMTLSQEAAAEAERATAEMERATAAANAAKAAVGKATDDRIAAERAATSATEKAAAFMRERMPPTNR